MFLPQNKLETRQAASKEQVPQEAKPGLPDLGTRWLSPACRAQHSNFPALLHDAQIPFGSARMGEGRRASDTHQTGSLRSTTLITCGNGNPSCNIKTPSQELTAGSGVGNAAMRAHFQRLQSD